ncbi:PIN domain-containing protein [Infirmifilum sp. NZ]|uniref:PIN domain-containing protein n=1 Tax=Infirmifilum sp. NZ TaxID=2926850 RepID=UPI002799A4D2|nr:PIN domain-containing protein [Infirmifilum sp. NZ]UNQ73590.1 PIN domain-containing protein [Infirmifilum sp. NZ]
MKILLDTSFLLPTLGIEVRGVASILERLRGHELYYTELSILEATWVAISVAKREAFSRDIFESGLQSIYWNYKRAELNPEITMRALELYESGHRDLIDCMLYSVALHYGMRFASLDRDLRSFVRKVGLDDVFLNSE